MIIRYASDFFVDRIDRAHRHLSSLPIFIWRLLLKDYSSSKDDLWDTSEYPIFRSAVNSCEYPVNYSYR